MVNTIEPKQRLYRVIEPNKDKEFEARFNQDFENKIYLVCLTVSDYLDGNQRWKLCNGRTEAYEFIKSSLENEFTDVDPLVDLDPIESFVLVDGLPLRDRKSVYAFMKYIQQYYDDGFDIEDYIDSSELTKQDSDDSSSSNNEPLSLYKMLNTGISMEEFMNGNRFFTMDLPKDGE